MMFVLTATMAKIIEHSHTIRGSTLVVVNATSEENAKQRFVASDDVTKHILDGWTLGPVNALHVTPESLWRAIEVTGTAAAIVRRHKYIGRGEGIKNRGRDHDTYDDHIQDAIDAALEQVAQHLENGWQPANDNHCDTTE